MSRSLALRIRLVGVEVRQTAARACLALAAKLAERGGSADAATSLAQARRWLRRFQHARVPFAHGSGLLVRAGIANLAGDAEAAVASLREAVATLDALETKLYAASARYRLGSMLGGAEGTELLAEAEAWMTAQSISDPKAIAATYAPGWI